MPKSPFVKSFNQARFNPYNPRYRNDSANRNGSADMVNGSRFKSKPPFRRQHALVVTEEPRLRDKSEDGALKFPFQRSSVEFNEFRRQASNVIDSKNLTSHFDGTYILPIKFNNKYTDDKLITEGEYNELDQKLKHKIGFLVDEEAQKCQKAIVQCWILIDSWNTNGICTHLLTEFFGTKNISGAWKEII